MMTACPTGTLASRATTRGKTRITAATNTAAAGVSRSPGRPTAVRMSCSWTQMSLARNVIAFAAVVRPNGPRTAVSSVSAVSRSCESRLSRMSSSSPTMSAPSRDRRSSHEQLDELALLVLHVGQLGQVEPRWGRAVQPPLDAGDVAELVLDGPARALRLLGEVAGREGLAQVDHGPRRLLVRADEAAEVRRWGRVLRHRVTLSRQALYPDPVTTSRAPGTDRAPAPSARGEPRPRAGRARGQPGGVRRRRGGRGRRDTGRRWGSWTSVRSCAGDSPSSASSRTVQGRSPSGCWSSGRSSCPAGRPRR